MERLSLLAIGVLYLCCSGGATQQFRPASVSEDEELFDHEVFDQEMLAGGTEQRMKLKDLSREEAAQEIRILMGRVDLNKDGKLDKEEIVAWLEKVEDRNYVSEANAVFAKEDLNGDGFVTFEEYWKNTEEEELPVSGENFNDAQVGVGIRFKDSDSNQDGRLDKEEFLPFIHPFRHDHMLGHLVEDQLMLYDGDRDGRISMAEYLSSFNPDQLPEDELPMVGDERSEFTNRLDMDHDGMLNYEEIKEWLVPDDVEFFQEEAQHLISHADKDEDGMLSLEEVDEEFDIFADSPITDYGHVMHEEL